MFSPVDLKVFYKGTKSVQQVKIMSIHVYLYFAYNGAALAIYFMIILEIAQYTYSSLLNSLEFVFLKTGRNGERCLSVSGLSSVTHRIIES